MIEPYNIVVVGSTLVYMIGRSVVLFLRRKPDVSADEGAATTTGEDAVTTYTTAADDWEKQFWAPAENKCFRCMPPTLATILRERHHQSMGAVGYTGTMQCVVCGNSRSHGLNDDRTDGQVAPKVRTGLEGT